MNTEPRHTCNSPSRRPDWTVLHDRWSAGESAEALAAAHGLSVRRVEERCRALDRDLRPLDVVAVRAALARMVEAAVALGDLDEMTKVGRAVWQMTRTAEAVARLKPAPAPAAVPVAPPAAEPPRPTETEAEAKTDTRTAPAQADEAQTAPHGAAAAETEDDGERAAECETARLDREIRAFVERSRDLGMAGDPDRAGGASASGGVDDLGAAPPDTS